MYFRRCSVLMALPKIIINTNLAILGYENKEMTNTASKAPYLLRKSSYLRDLILISTYV